RGREAIRAWLLRGSSFTVSPSRTRQPAGVHARRENVAGDERASGRCRARRESGGRRSRRLHKSAAGQEETAAGEHRSTRDRVERIGAGDERYSSGGDRGKYS